MLPVAGGAGGRGGAAGFNLDGIDTHSVPTVPGDCRMEEVDFDSTFEAGISGVDNSLEGFIPTIEMLLDAAMCPGESVTGCLDSTLLEQINTGALILLVEVGQIDDFRFDDHVTVQVALGQLVGGGVPALDGRFLAGGQTFEYAMSPSGEPLLLGPAYSADIFRGRVRLATSALPLSINTGTRQLDLSIVDAEMRFDISETTLTNGVIGGGLPNDDIVAAAAMLRADAAELVRTVVEGAADLRPDPADSARCAALSVGITFEAVAAQVQ